MRRRDHGSFSRSDGLTPRRFLRDLFCLWGGSSVSCNWNGAHNTTGRRGSVFFPDPWFTLPTTLPPLQESARIVGGAMVLRFVAHRARNVPRAEAVDSLTLRCAVALCFESLLEWLAVRHLPCFGVASQVNVTHKSRSMPECWS